MTETLRVAAALALPVLPWLLYRRLSRDDLMLNETRRRILQRLAAHPGLTMGALARELGVDPSTAQHHLDFLREFRSVEVRTIGCRQHYYAAGTPAGDRERLAQAILASEKSRRILSALQSMPDATLRAVSRSTGLPRSTVNWHVSRLRRFCLVEDQVGPTASPHLGPLATSARVE